MTFNFEVWLKGQQERVERLLNERMTDISKRAPAQLAEAMSYSLLGGGKRLRPVLVLACAETFGGKNAAFSKAVEDAACAIECIHTYSLVHDDLPSMDNDDLRRGQPTSHKKFGEAMAILAGDALLTDAFTMVSTTGENDELTRARLVAELSFAAGAGGMVGGQVLDIDPSRPAELNYLFRLHRMKTGALIRAACRMGAVGANVAGRALEAADAYGDAIGLAFQIADDVLDATSSAEVMGKPTGADANANRHTFPAVVGLEESKKMAQDQVQRALSAIEKYESTPGALAALAKYTVERKN